MPCRSVHSLLIGDHVRTKRPFRIPRFGSSGRLLFHEELVIGLVDGEVARCCGTDAKVASSQRRECSVRSHSDWDTLSSWLCRFLEVLAYVNHPLYLERLKIVRTA
jgi:hypothetical protein